MHVDPYQPVRPALEDYNRELFTSDRRRLTYPPRPPPPPPPPRPPLAVGGLLPEILDKSDAPGGPFCARGPPPVFGVMGGNNRIEMVWPEQCQ